METVMLTTQKALTTITEMDDAKRNTMIDELSEQDAKQLAIVLSKSFKASLSTVTVKGFERYNAYQWRGSNFCRDAVS